MIILVGECGCGKSSIEKILIEKYGYEKTISYTTKHKEGNEIDGVDYNFLSYDDFVEKCNNGFFVEYGSNNHNLYGTTKEQYKKNTVCILTPHGVKQIKRNLDKNELNISIFYIKVSRKDHLIMMFKRGDDVDMAIERDRVDVKLYENIEADADFVLNNNKYFSDPENMAYWIIECIKGEKNSENC